LTFEDAAKILLIELGDVQKRVIDSGEPFLISITDEAKKELTEQGYSVRYGARELRRVIDRKIVQPVARLISSKQIAFGDTLFIGTSGGKFTFLREKTKLKTTREPVIEGRPYRSFDAWYDQLPTLSIKPEPEDDPNSHCIT
jgi:ATP-dependent Clp protease ATP-binding subunit ClpC